MDVILLWWVSFTSFWRTRLIKWVCGVWEILQKWEKLSYSCLDPSNHSSMHISTDTKYINPWLKIVGWFLFLIHEENFNMKVLVLDAHFCSWRFFSSATRPSARIVEISPWKKEPHITPPNELQLKSRANLFVNLHFFLGCQSFCRISIGSLNFILNNLHESPGYIRSTKWTAFSARAEHLWVCAHLLLDPVSRAGEAELVMGGCWALHKVRVF